MADEELYIPEDSEVTEDVLREAIRSYKEALRRASQDLDVEYLVKTLKTVNLSSYVKVARNPVDKHHEWIPGTVLHNVGKVYVDDEHHLTLSLRKDNSSMTADKMLQLIDKAKKQLHGMSGPVMLEVSDDKKVQITDAYSHAFVKDMWAGLPFDVVLGYFEKDLEEE